MPPPPGITTVLTTGKFLDNADCPGSLGSRSDPADIADAGGQTPISYVILAQVAVLLDMRATTA